MLDEVGAARLRTGDGRRGFCPYRRSRLRRVERPPFGNPATDRSKHPALPGRRHDEHPSKLHHRNTDRRGSNAWGPCRVAERMETIRQRGPGLARSLAGRCREKSRATRAIIADSREPQGPGIAGLTIKFFEEHARDLYRISTQNIQTADASRKGGRDHRRGNRGAYLRTTPVEARVQGDAV